MSFISINSIWVGRSTRGDVDFYKLINRLRNSCIIQKIFAMTEQQGDHKLITPTTLLIGEPIEKAIIDNKIVFGKGYKLHLWRGNRVLV